MSNQVEYGIRIDVNGSQPAADAINRLTSSTAQLGTTAQNTSQAVQSAQNSQAASTASLQVAQTSLNESTRSQVAPLEAVATRHRAVQEATRNTDTTVRQLGISTAQTNAALRQVPAQFTDIVTSLQGGQAPLTVLLQQGGQLRDMFGSAGGAARALGGYVLGLITPFMAATVVAAGLAFAYKAGADESAAYSKSLALSGNAAGATASQLSDVAREVGQVAGSQRDAAAAITTLVSTGQVSIDNMKRFATTAVEAERVVGRSIADTAAEFAELGKAPLAALEKINDKYHFITAATYAQVKALQDQGKAAEAADAAQKAYADGIDKQRQKVLDSLTDWERGWIRIKTAASGAVDAVIDFAGGRDKSNVEKINTLLDERTRIEENLRRAQARGLGSNIAALEAELDLNKRQINIIRARGDTERAAATAQAEAGKADEARKKWLEDSDKYLTRAAQLERELTKARNEGKAAGVPQADIDKRLAAIRLQYSDVNNVARAAIDGQLNLEKQATADSLKGLESRHKQELVSDVAYVTAKRDLQLKDIDAEAAAINKQAALSAGNLAERAKFVAQLKVLAERRKGIIQDAQNTLDEYSHAATKAITDQSKSWENATKTERSALADEAALFGQSAEARKISAEQLKVDAELRQFVTNWQKQGHAFTAQEIADLQRSAAARKDNIAAIMGERQALAGAEQLRQENLKFVANSIADEETRAARLLEIDADLWRERIKLAGDGTDAQKKLQEQFDQWYANRKMAPVLDRWKDIIKNLDSDFREGFRNMLEHGHDAWSSFAKSIGNTLKASLADALYQTFIKKYVVQIVTSLAGAISGNDVAAALTGGNAAGSGSASSPVSAAMAAANLYKLVTGGFDKIGAAVSNGVDSVLGQFGPGTIGSTGPSAAAGMAGTVASYGAGLYAGHAIGNAIAGDYSVQHGQAVTNVASVIGAVVGGPIGAAIGGAIGGLINRAFGMGNKEVTATGLRGSVSSTGVNGENYSTWHQDGGWFRSDRGDTDRTPFSSGMVKQFAEGFGAIKAASAGFASDLGLSIDAIQSYSKDFNVTLTKDAAANEKAVTDLFVAIGDEMAQRLLPNFSQFSKAGESASTTLERLSGEFKATNQVAQLLGANAQAMFGAAGIESAVARERLIDLAGGVDVLGQQAGFFAQNFMTETERLAPVSAALDTALGSLGLKTIPTTRAQFKALINDLIATGAIATEAGAKQYASLMALAEAFAQVHPEVESTTDSITGARAALTEAYQAEADAIKETNDRMSSFATGLRGLRDSALLGDLSPLTPEQKYAEARSQFESTLAAARAGDVTAQGNYESAYTAFLNASKIVNASGAAYQRDFAYAQATTEEAIGWAEKQVDVGKASLAALEKQVTGLIDVKSAVQTVAEAINNLAVVMGNSGAGAMSTAQTSAIESLYESMLGRHSDVAGLQFWQQALASGVSISDIAGEFSRSSEYLSIHGSHANGLSRVPFDGYIAELHEDEAVLTAPEANAYRSMGPLSMAPLVSEIKALRTERQALVDELRGLRQDLARQASEQAEATVLAADDSANKIVQAVDAAKAGQVRETRVMPA
jgi:hypothetical protein